MAAMSSSTVLLSRPLVDPFREEAQRSHLHYSLSTLPQFHPRLEGHGRLALLAVSLQCKWTVLVTSSKDGCLLLNPDDSTFVAEGFCLLHEVGVHFDEVLRVRVRPHAFQNRRLRLPSLFPICRHDRGTADRTSLNDSAWLKNSCYSTVK